jgi:tetratricopeptide (TPR) repeat protein
MLLVLLTMGLLVPAGVGQSTVLDIPRASQHSLLVQRIGITDLTINYHRPLVGGRKIWGGIVPYGQVWRAGANENTTIEFTDPVTIEGKPLEKGIYGLHMIPGENEWTVIFSRNSSSWGSFTYKEAEDALRISVKPQATEMHEALAYDFDDVKPDSAVVTMRWEKVAVPFKVEVNTNQIVQESLHKQLRGLSQYTWEGWDDAANFLLASKVGLDDALQYSNRSILNEDRYDNEMTKANVLDALGKKNEAATARKLALAKANAVQMHTWARTLQGQGKSDEAYAIFRENAKKNPDAWVVHVGLSRMYCGQGDYGNAVKEMNLAASGAPEGQKQPLQALSKRLEAKEDINK